LNDRSPRFAGFDGVRAVAILLVIVWHTAVVTGFPEEAMGAFRPLIMSGWMGVDLFFALSGFLITTLLVREEAAGADEGVPGKGRIHLARFYLRRGLRILPIFYLVFAVNTLVLARFPIFSTIHARQLAAHRSFLGLVPYATFWGNYFPAYSPRFSSRLFYDPGESYLVYWSLCVEEHFYLLWPLFLFAVRDRRARLATALAVCAGVCVLRFVAAARGWEASDTTYHSVSHYRLDAILWGAAAALVHDRWPMTSAVRRGALGVGVAAVAALLVTRALSLRPPSTLLGLSVGMTALAVTAALLVLELGSAPRSGLARALEIAPLRSIGRVSYGMYLVHFQMMDLGSFLLQRGPTQPTLPAFFSACLLFAALSYAAAWVLYRAVERPFLDIKDRYFSAGRRR
jgi:peptidoglycan/LPS O-acetylase OafA/YrhL